MERERKGTQILTQILGEKSICWLQEKLHASYNNLELLETQLDFVANKHCFCQTFRCRMNFIKESSEMTALQTLDI